MHNAKRTLRSAAAILLLGSALAGCTYYGGREQAPLDGGPDADTDTDTDTDADTDTGTDAGTGVVSCALNPYAAVDWE